LVSQLAEYLHNRQRRGSHNELFRLSIDHVDISATQHTAQPQNPLYSIPHQIETSSGFSATPGGFEQESTAMRQHPSAKLGLIGEYNPFSQSHLQHPVQPKLGLDIQMEEATMSWGQSTIGIDSYERMSPRMSRTTTDLERPANTLVQLSAVDEGGISGEIALAYQYQSPSIHPQPNYMPPQHGLDAQQPMQCNTFATRSNRDTICELIDDYSPMLQNQQCGNLDSNARRTLHTTMTSQGQHKAAIPATSTIHPDRPFPPT